jgi:hypothetical protein
MVCFHGVADDGSRLAQQPEGLGLEGSDGTTHTLASGWESRCGVGDWCLSEKDA